MTLLLDQGLPRSTVVHLHRSGIEAIHVGDIGLAEADDPTILDYARRQGQTVVTLDADFHMRLALAGATHPNPHGGTARRRVGGLLVNVLAQCRDDLERGVVLSVTDAGLRLRRLPLMR